jgi:hypothetical protein
MKKYIFIFMFGLLMSCSSDLLDVSNPNYPTTATSWKTQEDAEGGVVACYHAFYNWNFNCTLYFRTVGTSDEATSNSPATMLKNFVMFRYTDPNYNENMYFWSIQYKAIFRSNQVLKYVPEIDFDDAAHKEDLLAQAKFLRSLNYFYIAFLYDKGPLVLEPSSPDDQPEEKTQEQMAEQMKKDLKEAIPHLPWERGNADKGRVTKGAAYALLGKICMMMHDWTGAKEAYDEIVINDGKKYYGLTDLYRDNFKHTTENNIESVFEIQFSDDNTVSSGIGGRGNDNAIVNFGLARAQYFGPSGLVPACGWGDVEARNWVVDEYKKEPNADGELDIRLRDNVFYKEMFVDFPGETIFGHQWNDNWDSRRCWIRKYEDDYYRNMENNYSPNNMRLIRYAGVLLDYAEVVTELSSGEVPLIAIECLNRVRQRPEVNMKPIQESIHKDCITSKDKFLKRLQTERVLELCFETDRWFDLKRWALWNTPEGLQQLRERDMDFDNFVPGKHERLPIPQSDVDNNPNLTQNPNY